MTWGEDAVTKLRENDPAFKALNILGEEIGDDEVLAIAEALRSNTTVTELIIFSSICNVCVGGEISGAAAGAIAATLRVNKTVRTLWMDGRAFASARSAMDIITAALQENSTLRELALEWENRYGRADTAIVAQVAFSIAAALRENTTLAILRLEGYDIGSAGVAALAEAIRSNQNLTGLTLNWIFNDKNDATTFAEALRDNNTLTKLELPYNSSIGDQGAAAITGALSMNSSIAVLGLKSTGMGNAGVKVLAEVLCTNHTITDLDLSENTSIGNDGAAALAKALCVNSCVTALNLSGAGIGNAGVKALAEALRTSNTLTKLELSSNPSIDNDGASAISNALCMNSSITTLSLKRTGIGSAGREALAKVLCVNRTLADLQC